jgi:ubiquinone/menaquinone biosynthesis C-methylase UbiE
VDDLLDQSFGDVSVLDISGAALDVARRRLGARAQEVQWIAGDITSEPLAAARYDIWHDRAVFHFLTDPNDRAAYVAQVRRAVKPGGHVIVAAFAPDGPLQCSGLPVVRYAPEALHAEFGGTFELLEHLREDHHTPGGAIQHFVYCHCLMH